jgi:glycoside/pentoside/hexuronide:cation symporter, GPH family
MSDSASDRLSDQNPLERKLDLGTKLAFGAGDLGTAITAMIGISYSSMFLTDVAGLSPGLAGSTQSLGKLWDAINDPLVGILSDKHRPQSKWGRRYPWMIWGAVPFGFFFFVQWIVPSNFSQAGLFCYYTAASILFNTFYTVINLPYTTLTAELTRNYDERTRLNGFRYAFSITGSVMAIAITLAVTKIFDQDRALQALIIGGVCATISVLPIYWCVFGTRKRSQYMRSRNSETSESASLPFLQQLKTTLTNIPFLYVIGIYLCSGLSFQLTAGIVPYFIVSWMRLPQIHVSLVFLAIQGTAMVMLFVWSYISRRIGKKAVYMMGTVAWLIAQIGLYFLQPGEIGLLYALCVMAGVGVSTAYLIPASMLPDVIELDELKTGQRREGVFYSFAVFIQKISIGFAIDAMLKSLGWAGYIQPTKNILHPIQPDSVLQVIRFFISPLPAIALFIGLILTYFYPITREAHQEILLELEKRKNQKP